MIYLDESTIGEDYMQFSDEQKRRLPNGTPVINVHVQTGTSLFPINVEQSFKIADEFFPTLFPNHKFKAYVCYSWLFSSGMQQLLPASSNILQFADTFEIIAENHDKEDAIQRIYGKRYRKTSDYPQRTSLQLHALHNFQLLGQGCGIRYRKEK